MLVLQLKFLTIFCVFYANFVYCSAVKSKQIGCRDENGDIVDWFYIYKLPRKYSGSPKTGVEYLYITPSTRTAWKLSSYAINSTHSMPGQTLAPAYDKKINSELLIVMYNDEPAVTINQDEFHKGEKGHTKGVVVANEDGGFWLVHSVPKYPPPIESSAYKFPRSGRMYGQSYLCISMDAEQMKLVGRQLKFNEPDFYSTNVPEQLEKTYRTFMDALKGDPIVTPPYHSTVTIRSIAGTKFKSFAKSANFNSELYEDLVAPHYVHGDFYVESWRHGSKANIPSDCTRPSRVYNIRNISIEAGKTFSFATQEDHSKWMVSENNDLICVGDINRQIHQKVRGGGTVCTVSEDLARIYTQSITGSEPCQKFEEVGVGTDRV